MNLNKREWLLLLLQEKPLDRIRLMKGLFLIWYRSGQKISNYFEFVPYLYGPCSFDFYETLRNIKSEGLITQAPHPVERWSPYFLTNKGKVIADGAWQKADQTTRELIKSIANEVSSLNFYDLLTRVYKEAPKFAEQSVFVKE